jgi:hypothetical protein
LPELWTRYGRHFSPYLQRRIDTYRAELVQGTEIAEIEMPILPHVSVQSMNGLDTPAAP